MKFGFDGRRRLTGTDLAVRIFQIASLLPVFYFFAVAGYPAILTQRGFFSGLFRLGFSILPRLESLAISAAYRFSSSEMVVCFGMLAVALAVGVIMKRRFRLSGPASRPMRLFCAAFIAVDLVLRLLPLHFNRAFGTPAAIAGFAVQAVCLALVLLDLRAARAEPEKS